jgi:hypothetical protein
MLNLAFLSFPIGNSMKQQVFAILLAVDNHICKVFPLIILFLRAIARLRVL